jgi:hypothetical protein
MQTVIVTLSETRPRECQNAVVVQGNEVSKYHA